MHWAAGTIESPNYTAYARFPMPEVNKTVLIDQTPQQMFELVDRCEDYAQFLPWCGGAIVHERTPERTDATLKVDYHGVRTSFRTVNDKTPPYEMVIRLKEGPFKHLHGRWRFLPLGQEGCKIVFELHYEFSSKLLEKVLGPVFERIAQTFVDAFVQRASQLPPHANVAAGEHPPAQP